MQTLLKRSAAAVLTFMVPSLSFGGPLKEHFQGYPSPSGSVAHKTLGLVEVAGGGYAVWQATKIANRNSYRKFTQAYEEYQRAVQRFENAGGAKVSPAAGEQGVAVVAEAEIAKSAAAGEVQAAASEVQAAAGEASAAAEGAASGTGNKAAVEQAAETTERAADKLRTAASRLQEGVRDAARQSPLASRALNLRGTADELTRAGEAMAQARQKLLATASEVLAQEGTAVKQAFAPLQNLTGDRLVVPQATLAEARAVGAAIRTATIVGQLAGVLLVADGIYRLYLIQDMRNPGVFPLGWAGYHGARKIFVRDSSKSDEPAAAVEEPARLEEQTLQRSDSLQRRDTDVDLDVEARGRLNDRQGQVQAEGQVR